MMKEDLRSVRLPHRQGSNLRRRWDLVYVGDVFLAAGALQLQILLSARVC